MSWLGAAFVLTLLAGAGSIVVYSLISGITPLPSSRQARGAMVAAVPATPAGPIYELGSGWGQLAFELADRFPERPVAAFEISPLPAWFSKLRLQLAPRPNLRIERRDFRTASLTPATCITAYLYPAGMERLRYQLEAQAKPGTWLISNTFALRPWPPEAEVEVRDLHRSRVIVYRVPVPTSDTIGPR